MKKDNLTPKKQLGFFVNSKKCIGCFSCAMACKNQYQQPVSVLWRKVYHLYEDIYPHRNRGFYSLACNHCQNPECLKACPVKAYSKREEDGIVIHDQDKCIGCGNCIRACPFGAPQYNPELKKAEKCSLCWQRIDNGLVPACILSCPVDALELIDINSELHSKMISFPKGFPKYELINPSVRFIVPVAPNFIWKDQS